MSLSQKIKAFIVNRNLLTTLKNTVDFLLKEPRIDVIIFDQQSDYAPLLEYYKTVNATVVYSPTNAGPHSVWGETLKGYFNTDPFIVADSDCIYDGVPSDWLDKMLNVLNTTTVFKVGFSLNIEDLPDSEVGKQAKEWEAKYWTKKIELGWDAHIDTTFALYRPYSGFSYDAVRLDKPYCINHVPWYLTNKNITDEWRYYLNTASSVSTWGTKLKTIINNMNYHEVNRFGMSFNVVDTPLNSKFWVDHYTGWQQSTFDFIIPRLDKDKTFIDIGAWIGPISLVAAQFSKQCICFEPDPVANKEFADNIKLNNINNIILEDKAISMSLELSIGSAVLGESITRDSCTENAIVVGCMTPSDIFNKYDIKGNEISVIKIDIEGHEQQLLKEHSVLWELNIPMHISLHPGWATDKEKYFRDIIPFLVKKNIDITNLHERGNFFDVTFK